MSTSYYFHLRFSRPIYVEANDTRKINPKRLQRIVRREICSSGIGTKAQQAVKLDYETRKLENKKIRKEDKEEQEKIIFKRRQDKKKDKKKGH